MIRGGDRISVVPVEENIAAGAAERFSAVDHDLGLDRRFDLIAPQIPLLFPAGADKTVPRFD